MIKNTRQKKETRTLTSLKSAEDKFDQQQMDLLKNFLWGGGRGAELFFFFLIIIVVF